MHSLVPVKCYCRHKMGIIDSCRKEALSVIPYTSESACRDAVILSCLSWGNASVFSYKIYSMCHELQSVLLNLTLSMQNQYLFPQAAFPFYSHICGCTVRSISNLITLLSDILDSGTCLKMSHVQWNLSNLSPMTVNVRLIKHQFWTPLYPYYSKTWS